MSAFSEFFSNDGFMPHIHCYLDKSSLVWTMVATDFFIGLSYVIISATLYVLVRRVKLPYSGMFLAFGLFILACGTTHFMEVYNLWVPNYWLAAFVKAVTVVASLATAVYLLKKFPQIIELVDAARNLNQSKTSVEEYFKRRVTTPPEVRKLLPYTLFLPLVFAGLLIVTSVLSMMRLAATQRWIDHSDTVIVLGNRLERDMTKAQTSYRDYVYSKNDDFRQSAIDSDRDYENTIASLKPMHVDNPQQASRLQKIDDLFRKWQRERNDPLLSVLTKERKDQFANDTLDLQNTTRKFFDDYLGEEHRILAERTHRARAITSLFIFAIASLGITIGFLILILSRNSLLQISRNYEAALKNSDDNQQKLQKALSSRDEFLSIASHELRTPITALKLQLQLTRRTTKPELNLLPPPQKLAKMLDTSEIQINRLGELVDHLLDVTRIEAGKLSFSFAEVDLVELLDDVLERYEENFRTASCPVSVEMPQSLVVTADRFRLEQVLLNLLSNACKFGSKKPIEIKVSKQGSYARILVRDHGVGIPADKYERIFERFERVEGSQRIAGLGLGLYISRELVKGHGGTIHVESTMGESSTFIVEIPISQDRAIITAVN